MTKRKNIKMEELKASPVSNADLDVKPNEPECLTVEELQNILQAKSRAVQLTIMAEKSVAQARVAELEAQNIILLTYNKYQLNQSIGDSISENGLINRVKTNPEKNNGQ